MVSGRILQIGRHHHSGSAPRVVQAAGDGHVGTRVPGQPQAPVGPGQALEHGERAIPGLVVDDDPLPVGVEPAHGLDDARVERFEVLGFVERGRDERQHQAPSAATSAPTTRS